MGMADGGGDGRTGSGWSRRWGLGWRGRQSGKVGCRVYPDAASGGRVGGEGEQQGQQMATGAAEEASTGSGSGDMAAAAAARQGSTE